VSGQSANAPLVSVIVPVYNVEAYLAACVESLVAQTWPAVEIILVDDGSTDSSGGLCDGYEAAHGNVISLHKPNGGLSDARNFGVTRCHGDCVMFVDSDDYVSPVFVEALVCAARETGCAIAAVPFATSFYDDEDAGLARTLGEVAACGQPRKLSAKEYIDMLLRHTCDTGAPFRTYPRDAVLDCPFPVGLTFEDAATVYRMVHDAGDVALVPCERLYAYRQRGGSIIHSGADDSMVESAISIGRQVESDMRAWYPYGWHSACSCGFSINRVALMRTMGSQKDYRKRLWDEMRRYRAGLLHDSGAKPVKRAAAALSYLGMDTFLAFSRAFDRAKEDGVR
jgi:glycosyltransferase involved in cell wall biosynthesis